jgi:tetratricopeptide (TPR) repeat protein
MASTPFVELSGAIVQAMGQRLDAAKPSPEGLVLRTGDGFLYAFLEDPARVSLDAIERLFDPRGFSRPVHVAVLTPGHLPLAISEDVVRRSGTLVEGARFAELARQLGLETLLGEEPHAPRTESRRLLPSAQLLDEIMHRARTWLDWGVPALALRFYRQAADLKPGFLPARVGVGRSLLALGLVADADRTFDEVLRSRPDDVDARLGKAAVFGARSQPKQEVEMYRRLLEEDQARNEVRAHLLAALIELKDWPSARIEIEALLARTPEQPQLRFLHSVALRQAGKPDLADEEREEARRLGLSYDQESTLCQHLGLPPPPRPPPPPERVAPPSGPSRRVRRTRARAREMRTAPRSRTGPRGKARGTTSRAAGRNRK